VTAFFDKLSSLDDDPSLRKVSGTIRFDLARGKQTERWLVTIRKGDLTVSHRNVAADTVIGTPRSVEVRSFMYIVPDMPFSGDRPRVNRLSCHDSCGREGPPASPGPGFDEQR
jgi:hypothetical protein